MRSEDEVGRFTEEMRRLSVTGQAQACKKIDGASRAHSSMQPHSEEMIARRLAWLIAGTGMGPRRQLFGILLPQRW